MDREKAILRLMLQGYDVKASAQELGISAYVANERLRDARRKLGVTSSREAARILAQHESGATKFSVDMFSGIAPDGPDAAIPVRPDRQAGDMRDNAGLSFREHQAPFAISPDTFAGLSYFPLRKPGEIGSGLNKRERIVAIFDLTTKLAAAIALICLVALLLNTVLQGR
ncbi:MAG: helix-turn-helix transcriptional regulator [Sphingorhabdus sp.]